MSGHTVPIDFWIDSSITSNKDEREKIFEGLCSLLKPFSGPLSKASECSIPGGFMIIFASDTMTMTVKLYNTGLVSANVEYFVSEDSINIHKIVNDDGRRLEKQIQEQFGAKRAKVLPALKRAPPINPYLTTSDDRILEYDVDEVIFEEQSPFQKVQILGSKSFKNMLVLDDLQNLAESDLSYTHGLMNKEEEEFKNKEILILGGGDGALLWELLKENPKFITMIDIDEVVVKCCRKYMRSVCGDCMDNYEGKNYKIIIDDAIAYMKTYLKEGRQFDYIFGDLTDVPISNTPRGEHWDFMRSIMGLGTQLLRPVTGKYMTHAIGVQCTSALRMFEEQFKVLPVPVSFTRTSCYVPSFMEKWCFYQLTRK